MAARASERSRMVKKVKGKEARTERTSEVRRSLYLGKCMQVEWKVKVAGKLSESVLHARIFF